MTTVDEHDGAGPQNKTETSVIAFDVDDLHVSIRYDARPRTGVGEEAKPSVAARVRKAKRAKVRL